MLKIRKNVFETNSSSSHSISISNDKTQLYQSISPDEKGIIYITGGEYGWEWNSSTDAFDKANYCAQDVELDKLKLQMLEEVLLEHTGAKKIVFELAGYIDHQSQGTSREAFRSKEKLKDFIFNPTSMLFTGNDNSVAPPNFYDNPNAVYRYEGKIKGYSNSIKFEQKPNLESLKNGMSELFGSEDENHDYNYRFYDSPCKTTLDTEFSSFDKIKENKIVLYKTESKYVQDGKQSKYIGAVILDTKELTFSIEKIKNVKKSS